MKRTKKLGKTLTPPRKNFFHGRRNVRYNSYRTGKSAPFIPARPKRKAGKFVSFLKKFFILTALGGIIGYGIWLAVFSNFFIVKDIRYQLEETELVEAELNPYVNEILGSNIITLKVDSYEKQIEKAFPQIESVKIRKIFPSTIEVSASTFAIKANIINKYGGLEKKFLINEGGYLVSKDLENPNFPYIIVNSEKEFELKIKLLDPARLEKILQSISLYEDFFNMKVFDALYLPVEREVHLRTEKYFFVWLDLQLDIEQQLKKLKKALPKVNIYQDPLEYIDLRITAENAEKIYVKRR